MTDDELASYLKAHPDWKLCPHCGGAGKFPIPVGEKWFECTVCKGDGVVKR